MPTARFLFIMTALVLMMYGLASAQTRPARQRGGPELQRLQEAIAKLDLTDDQKQQVEALKDSIAETARGMAKEVKKLPPEERREKMREAMGDVREKFMSILTPEQKQKLPEAGRPGPRGGGGTPLIDRLKQTVDALDLTAEQKTQTDAIFKDAADQAKALRTEAGGDRAAMREKAGELGRETREKLAAVLTPEQKAKLKESMPAGRRGDGAGPGEAGPRKAGKGKGKGGADRGPATQPAASDSTPSDLTVAKAAAGSSPATPAATPLVAGSPAPAFTLTRLSGATVTNKSLAGKPLVLAFGSLTSPAFRDRVPQLEALKNRYRSRANLLIVYTREAHPAGEWQVKRNRDDKLDLPAPATFEERVALAKQLRERTNTTLDLAVDSMDDAVTHAYGNAPQGAAVVSAYGTLVGTQTFCDPSGLPRLIDAALKIKE